MWFLSRTTFSSYGETTHWRHIIGQLVYIYTEVDWTINGLQCLLKLKKKLTNWRLIYMLWEKFVIWNKQPVVSIPSIDEKGTVRGVRKCYLIQLEQRMWDHRGWPKILETLTNKSNQTMVINNRCQPHQNCAINMSQGKI